MPSLTSTLVVAAATLLVLGQAHLSAAWQRRGSPVPSRAKRASDADQGSSANQKLEAFDDEGWGDAIDPLHARPLDRSENELLVAKLSLGIYGIVLAGGLGAVLTMLYCPCQGEASPRAAPPLARTRPARAPRVRTARRRKQA
jgi:hypothetical protein